MTHRRTTKQVAICLSLAAVLALSQGSAAHATSYDEAVSGDFSNDPLHPTAIGNLTLGANQISGSTIPSGAFNPMTHADAVQDPDYFSFVVPTNERLSAIDVETGSSIQPMDRMFFGIATGSDVMVNPSFTSAAGLLGWTLVSASDIGTDVLPALGLSQPPNFPHVPGATGFSGPLPSGTYTIWLLDGDTPADYKLNLQVGSVPEPGTWALMLVGFGALGATMRRGKIATRVRFA